MLGVLRDCCDVLLRQNDDFWATAALTGCSYETGESDDLCAVVNSLDAFGLASDLKSQLLKGVNGNLAALVEKRHAHLHPFSPNVGWKKIRPDLRFGGPDTIDEVVAEVKALHDLTTYKFYGGGDHSHTVANDRDKLTTIRSHGFKGHLFQIVFFLQLPAFERPSGTWTRSGNRSKAWGSFRVITGINKQYRYLRRFLIDEPVAGPVVHPLIAFGTDVLNCMSRRYSEGYISDDASWSFSSERHLADAAVGYAIWQY